jgi:hypothetical protein
VLATAGSSLAGKESGLVTLFVERFDAVVRALTSA